MLSIIIDCFLFIIIEMSKLFQIAMDGPAGAGKSTIAKAVAKKLGFTFINSGGMYRCIAIALKDVDLNDEHAIKKVLKEITVTQQGDVLLLNDADVSAECYSTHIANLVPQVSKIPCVREKCHDCQMKLADGANIVIEGRDTTTVMFPNATLKVYVTADDKLRATRR
jgi:cytidylate kinase